MAGAKRLARIGRSEATGSYLGGGMAGAKQLACIGRSEATGLYLGGGLAGAKGLARIWVVDWQERSDWLVLAGAKRLACI